MRHLRRSMVVVPGNVSALLEKSRKLEADVLIFDLQDAIRNDDGAKLRARSMVIDAIRGGGFRAREICVRINNPDSPWVADDIKAAVQAGADSITISRAMSARDVLFVESLLDGGGARFGIIAEVDTPGLLADLSNLTASCSRVTGLQVAAYDFGLELGTRLFGPERTASFAWIDHARAQILTAARAKGWTAGDMVDPALAEPNAVEAAMRASRETGFDGVAILYPRHVPLANQIYGVSDAERDWALDLVSKWAAMDDSSDADRAFRIIDGVATFAPTLEYAQRMLVLRGVIDRDPAASARFAASGLASPTYLPRQDHSCDEYREWNRK